MARRKVGEARSRRVGGGQVSACVRRCTIALFVLVAGVFVAAPAAASDGDMVWARQLGGTGSDIGLGVAVDGSGNVYTTGYFSGTADFDPGAGTLNLASVGAVDVFVSKLDAAGTLVWVRQLGGTSTDVGEGVVVDGSGNVYTTGYFSGTADFDPGAGTLNLASVGAVDVFVSKLDAAGTLVWVRQLGGTSTDVGEGVVVDGSGNVYTTGYFSGTADFDPGAGTLNLASVGAVDVFVSKLDAAGTLVWARQLGGTSLDAGFGVAVDGSGNVHTTGYFLGTADFDPGAGTSNLTSAGTTDVFVSKLDAAGTLVWARQLGGTSLDAGFGVAVDGSGNVHTTGYFLGTADFDPGAGTSNLTSAGTTDVFVSKLDAAGTLVWARQLGGTSLDAGFGVAVDGSGNVHTTGYFLGTADFDPGAGTSNLTSAGTTDVFVSKLDAAGTLVWARQLGGTSLDAGFGVAVDGSGNVHTTGYFLGTADFDPGAGTSNLTSAGTTDVFVSKLDAAGTLVWARQLGGTSLDAGFGVAVDGSGNVHTTGYFLGTADFDPGTGTFNLASVGGGDVFVSKLEGPDTTDPVVTPPGDVVAEATGPGGAVVSFGSGSASDGVGVVSGPTCVPASGSLFPVGVTTVTCSASDAAGNTGEATFAVTVVDPAGVFRYAGANRFATAAAVVADDFPVASDVSVVFVAVGSNFPDALAGAAVAGKLGAPLLLLVNAASIPAETAAELTRLSPDTIVVLGGTAVISEGVEDLLGGYASTVIRLAGANRYATAVEISQYGFPGGATEVIVATGTGFADALAGGPAAVALGGPVLLTDPNSLPQEVADEITRLAPTRIVVVGGTSAVSATVFSQLQALVANTVRISGSNRYATAVALSVDAFDTGSQRVYVATGLNFPDALAGAAAAGWWQAPILLVPGTSIPADVSAEITRLGASKVIIVGGTSAVSLSVEGALFSMLGATPANPGDAKNCSNFTTQAAAQEWFDFYFPYYGDVGDLDGDDDLEACENLP